MGGEIIQKYGNWETTCFDKKIYYAVSNDLCNKKMKNIWRISKVSLPYEICDCKCMITHQNTMHPKLVIVGDETDDTTIKNNHRMHLEYDLSDIMKDRTTNAFPAFMDILNFKKVRWFISHLFWVVVSWAT